MVKLNKPNTSKGLANLCAKIADEKLAQNILALNLKKIDSAVADFFVLCTCNSPAQIKAVSDSILNKCKDLKLQNPRVEGTDNNQWVLLDFFDVVVHIMLPDIRAYYHLEKLWGDAQFLTLNDNGYLRISNSL